LIVSCLIKKEFKPLFSKFNADNADFWLSPKSKTQQNIYTAGVHFCDFSNGRLRHTNNNYVTKAAKALITQLDLL
jgi:hypothetical protein